MEDEINAMPWINSFPRKAMCLMHAELYWKGLAHVPSRDSEGADGDITATVGRAASCTPQTSVRAVHSIGLNAVISG